MAEKRSSELSYEDHEIAGHDVRIVRTGRIERLLIDGRPCRVKKTDSGYVLAANAYVEPQKTLLAAVKLHLARSDDQAL